MAKTYRGILIFVVILGIVMGLARAKSLTAMYTQIRNLAAIQNVH